MATTQNTPAKVIAAAGTNATSINAGATLLGVLCAGNTAASARFVKLYDLARVPVVGTDVPVAIFIIPGNATGAGSNVVIGTGLRFLYGLALAITGGIADSDATAIAANDVCVSLGYCPLFS